jgi:hypothetical protein
LRSYDSAPPPPPPVRASCLLVELTDGKGGRGWARSQIIRPRESLALYKRFNTFPQVCFSPHLLLRCSRNPCGAPLFMPFGFASPSFGENRAEPLGEIQFADTSPPERDLSPAEAEFFFHPLRPYF